MVTPAATPPMTVRPLLPPRVAPRGPSAPLRPFAASTAESQDTHLQLFRLVSELMADDLSLAEQLRAAITGLWLAVRRARDPGAGLPTLRDVQRAEEQLRVRLYRAMRGGTLSPRRFDEAMALLRAPLAALALGQVAEAL